MSIIDLMGNIKQRSSDSFFKQIGQEYGRLVSSQLSEWSNTKIALAKQFNQKVFLLKCKKLGLPPKRLDTRNDVFLIFYI